MLTEEKVSVVMGSTSDWGQMKHCCELLDELNVPYTKHVVSAHRMPDEMFTFAKEARSKGIKVIIAGAGGAAHLPGMIAAQTSLPVIGVPMKSSSLNGLDSLLSIVQMPAGVPVATMAIGASGAKNAGLMASRILSLKDETIYQSIQDYKDAQNKASIESEAELDNE